MLWQMYSLYILLLTLYEHTCFAVHDYDRFHRHEETSCCNNLDENYDVLLNHSQR